MNSEQLDKAAQMIFNVVTVYLAKFPDAGPSQLRNDLPELNELGDFLDLYTAAVDASKTVNPNFVEVVSLERLQKEAKSAWDEFQKVLNG